MMRIFEGFGGLSTYPLIVSHIEKPRTISLYPNLIQRKDETLHGARQTGKIRAYSSSPLHLTTVMEFLKDFFSQPFVLGLIVGLLPTALAWKSAFATRHLAKKERQKQEKELIELKAHLQTQLTINASGNDSLQKELEQLRSQNEILRINLAAAQQKPGRAEMRHLQITEAAVRTMREQAPGFAQAWERAMRDAEQIAEQQDSGLVKIMRRMIPSLGLGKAKPESQSDDAQNGY